MTNQFAHKQSWPEAKARIVDNLAELQDMLRQCIANGFDSGQAADTLAALANVNRITTQANQ
jgi:hypothetical protein